MLINAQTPIPSRINSIMSSIKRPDFFLSRNVLSFFPIGNMKIRPMIMKVKYGTMAKLLAKKSVAVAVGLKKESPIYLRSSIVLTRKRSQPIFTMIKV